VLELGPDLLPVARGQKGGPASAAPAPSETLEDVERRHIQDVLQQSRWVIEGEAGAAKRLGLHPNTLRSRMTKLGITRAPHGIS
jgi:transcriptional regulator with GAF, ATPase, and Fis domain